jgi:hypothetical protein
MTDSKTPEALVVHFGPDAANPNNRRLFVNGQQWAKVYGWDKRSVEARADTIATALSAPSPIPAAPSDVAGLRQVIDWLEQLARADDMDDVAADGGVTVAMIYQQEAAMQARRLKALSHDREVMRGALEPFAALAEMVGEAWTDETPAFVGADGVIITIGQLRRARAALASLKGGA